MACISSIVPSKRQYQAGQALVESLVAVSLLALIWVAVHWLASYQDMSLSATHASRHAAFIGTRLTDTSENSQLPDSVATAVEDYFFAGAAHRWVSLQGEPVLDRHTSLNLKWSRDQKVSDFSQPGHTTADGKVLRQEWALEDAGMLRARVQLHPMYPDTQRVAKQGLSGLRGFPPKYLSLDKSISILTDAGHSGSDTEVQTKVGASELAWAPPIPIRNPLLPTSCSALMV